MTDRRYQTMKYTSYTFLRSYGALRWAARNANENQGTNEKHSQQALANVGMSETVLQCIRRLQDAFRAMAHAYYYALMLRGRVVVGPSQETTRVMTTRDTDMLTRDATLLCCAPLGVALPSKLSFVAAPSLGDVAPMNNRVDITIRTMYMIKMLMRV